MTSGSGSVACGLNAASSAGGSATAEVGSGANAGGSIAVIG
jgi:hypothetical protein